MCNRYNIRGTIKDLAEVFQATLPMDFDLVGDDGIGRTKP
jgi:hypothetical protein